MKTLYVFIAICGIMLTSPAYAKTSSEEINVIKEQTRSVGVSEVLSKLENGKYVWGQGPKITPSEVFKELLKGNFNVAYNQIFEGIINLFLSEVRMNLGMLTQIIMILLILSIVNNMRSNFAEENILSFATGISILVIGGIVFTSVYKTIIGIEKTISQIIEIIQVAYPALISLMLASGNLVSATVLRPATLFSVQLCAVAVKSVILPLITTSLILAFAGRICTQIQVTKISKLLRNIAGWIVGILFTTFAGIITIQGAVGGTFDGVAAKTMKFAIGNFVPVVGKYLADSFDTVAGCTTIVKNSLGIVILLGVASICLVPMLKLISLALIYKIASVLAEPIAESRIVTLLDEISVNIIYIFAGLVVVSMMFFIMIASMTIASNIGYLAR